MGLSPFELVYGWKAHNLLQNLQEGWVLSDPSPANIPLAHVQQMKEQVSGHAKLPRLTFRVPKSDKNSHMITMPYFTPSKRETAFWPDLYSSLDRPPGNENDPSPLPRTWDPHL